jgi:hypothetical protein
MIARLFSVFLSLATLPAMAGLVVEPPPGVDEPRFYEQLKAMLSELAQSKDPVLRRLYETAKAAPAAIRIRPMTDDKSTWNSDGSRTRGHTDPDDKRPKGEGRRKPADATVFLPPDAVEPGKLHWKSGTLAHELTHAIDLASGRYDPIVTVRERRATFMQNAWRQQSGHPLRTSYHNRFPTLDYQDAVSRGALDEYVDYLFTRSDFPKPKHASVPADAARDVD